MKSDFLWQLVSFLWQCHEFVSLASPAPKRKSWKQKIRKACNNNEWREMAKELEMCLGDCVRLDGCSPHTKRKQRLIEEAREKAWVELRNLHMKKSFSVWSTFNWKSLSAHQYIFDFLHIVRRGYNNQLHIFHQFFLSSFSKSHLKKAFLLYWMSWIKAVSYVKNVPTAQVHIYSNPYGVWHA